MAELEIQKRGSMAGAEEELELGCPACLRVLVHVTGYSHVMNKTFRLNWTEILATAIVCIAIIAFEAWAFFM